MSNDALTALKELRWSYIIALENGRDRILWLGGECDSLETMIKGDPALIAADKAIEALTAQQATQPSGNLLLDSHREIQAMQQALCVDEGCPHHGTKHTCIDSTAAKENGK